MTNDELLSLRRDAKANAALLEAAGLHRSKTYSLIHSDLPIIIDQLMRSNAELAKVTKLYDDMRKAQTYEARTDVVKALLKTKVFPKKWVDNHFPIGGHNVKG